MSITIGQHQLTQLSARWERRNNPLWLTARSTAAELAGGRRVCTVMRLRHDETWKCETEPRQDIQVSTLWTKTETRRTMSWWDTLCHCYVPCLTRWPCYVHVKWGSTLYDYLISLKQCSAKFPRNLLFFKKYASKFYIFFLSKYVVPYWDVSRQDTCLATPSLRINSHNHHYK